MLDMRNNSFLSSCYFSLELKCLKYGNTQKPSLCKNSLSVWAEECIVAWRRDVFQSFKAQHVLEIIRSLYMKVVFCEAEEN